MATRTQVAQYVARQIQTGSPKERTKALNQAAQWLKSTGKQRQSEYLIKDISFQLEQNGYVYTEITTARPVSEKTINLIKNYITDLHNAKYVEITTKIDSNLIGGVKIETPLGILDSSVKARLAKIVEGVI